MDRSNEMHVIMTYHTLETRNPRFINPLWEKSVYTGLILIITFGIISNLSIQSVLDTYEDISIFTAIIHFRNKSTTKTPINTTTTMMRAWERLAGSNKNAHIITHIYKTLKSSTEFVYLVDDIDIIAEICEREEKNYTQCITDPKLHEEIKKDKEFVTDMVVDNNRTVPGSDYVRDYMVFYPLFSAIVAIQWSILLYNFRVGSFFFQDWKTSKPWIMVVPAIIFYAVMTIGSAVYNHFSDHYFLIFCDSLKMNLTHPEIFSCGYLMDNLYMVSWEKAKLLGPGSLYYNVYEIGILVVLLLWLSILIIVFLRWLLGIDFQLLRVTITAFIPSKEIMFDKKTN